MSPTANRFPIGTRVRLERGPDLDYQPRIWVGRGGDLIESFPDTPAKRAWLARKLREAANWLEYKPL